MCGRYSLLTETYDFADAFGLEEPPRLVLSPRYNIAPTYSATSPPLIVRVSRQGSRELVPARWWLIPSWWKKPLKDLPTSFNARAEDLDRKPFFEESFARRRCLVPASGWYEFRGAARKKESFYFHLPGHEPLAFAGVWDRWVSPEGEIVDSFAVLTTEASEIAKAIHDRMPLVIRREDYDAWLDSSAEATRTSKELLRPRAMPLVVYKTSGYGNDARREGPECLAAAP